MLSLCKRQPRYVDVVGRFAWNNLAGLVDRVPKGGRSVPIASGVEGPDEDWRLDPGTVRGAADETITSGAIKKRVRVAPIVNRVRRG